MRDALKLFYFLLKKFNVRKGIFFLFYQIAMETLFKKELKWKIFTIAISGWSTTFPTT